MSNLFYTGLFVLAVWSLFRDFKKTPGFVSEKIQHVIFIFFLFTTNATAFRIFFEFIRNYATYAERSMTAQLEYMPVFLSFSLSLFSSMLGVLVYVLCFALLARADFARKALIWAIPFYIVTMLPSLHLAFRNRVDSENGFLAFVVVGSFLAFYAVIFFVYKGVKMKRFFYAKKTLA